MSRPPNFKTIVMSSILLEAYFREHSINVTIVPIVCQMAEISVKNGPIVIKKSYGFDFGGDFCSYVQNMTKIMKNNEIMKIVMRDPAI